MVVRRLAQAAYDQLKKMAYAPMTQSHEPAILLAEKLNEMLGGDYNIFYSNSGSDANEMALNLRVNTISKMGNRTLQIYFPLPCVSWKLDGGTGCDRSSTRKYKYEALAPGFLHVAPPDNYRRPAGQSIEEYNIQRAQEFEEKIIWEQKETIAGIIMEPLITGGGILIPHPIYLKRFKESVHATVYR